MIIKNNNGCVYFSFVVNNNGDIDCFFFNGALSFSSYSVEKYFDICCNYFYFSVASKEPFVKDDKKEYVHSYLYMLNPFKKRLTKIFYFGKFIFLVELDSYARN